MIKCIVKILPNKEINLQTKSKNCTENWEKHLWGSSVCGVNKHNLNCYLLECLIKGTEITVLGEYVENVAWICKLFWHSWRVFFGLIAVIQEFGEEIF